jgi:glycosyltransferase involved in cell wall biosynthesis
MSPQISIVVPVYNVQAYLAACLDSILAQTTKDFEVICVEDCSTDGSPSILQSYSQKDSRIRVIRHARNSGLSAARNTGIDESRGEWVLFVDSDDVVSKTLCERTLAAAREVEADVVFYGHTAFRDGEPPPGEPARAKPVPADRRALLARQAFAWTKLVRRDLLIARKVRFPVGLCFEDVPVHWRLALESARPALLDEAHIGYRQRSGSITYRKDWTRADGLKIYDLIATQLRESGNWDDYATAFRIAEMRNFAATHAYFELANPNLIPRVVSEVSSRMSCKHIELAKSRPGISGWQRSLALAVFCRPSQVGLFTWLGHRTHVFMRSIARIAFNKLKQS